MFLKVGILNFVLKRDSGIVGLLSIYVFAKDTHTHNTHTISHVQEKMHGAPIFSEEHALLEIADDRDMLRIFIYM